MAPKDPIHLPAYTQAGKLEMESKRAFDTLTEYMNDAKENGYEKR